MNAHYRKPTEIEKRLMQDFEKELQFLIQKWADNIHTLRVNPLPILANSISRAAMKVAATQTAMSDLNPAEEFFIAIPLMHQIFLNGYNDAINELKKIEEEEKG